MPLLTTNFNDLVRNALVTWRTGYDDEPFLARQLFDTVANPWQTSDYSHIDGPGFARRKSQGDSYTIGNPRQGYTLTLTKSRIGLETQITWEMRKYDKYREMEKQLRLLGRSVARRIELDLTHLFTFGLQGSSYTNMDGETVSTTTGDGVQIFSNSHTITSSSANVDNYNGTTAFSRSGLEAAERLFANMTDMNAVKVVPKPDVIVTSDDPAMINAVGEFLKSVLIPDASDNATNMYKSKYKHLALPYLATTNVGAPTTTGAYYWMLMDTKMKDAILEFSEMPTFTMGTEGNSGVNFNTDDITAKASASYAYGILDYKFLVGSAATTV